MDVLRLENAMSGTAPRRAEMESRVAYAAFLVELFDRVPEVVVAVKDDQGRYLAINETLVQRLGLADKRSALDRTAPDLWPAPLGERYLAQDLTVMRTGVPIVDLLELHIYPNRREGWCLTTKVPIRGADGTIIGVAGASRDVGLPAAGSEAVDDLVDAVRLIHEQSHLPLRVNDLATKAGLSVYQFNRRIHRLFGLTASKLIVKTRIDAACRMLQEGDSSIAEVALACGYCDQSAFTRQFKSITGLPPAKYRDRHRPPRARDR